MSMTEKECLEVINSGQESAYGLLTDADPNLAKRFNRACTTLKKILDDTRKHFPDAEYYTASGGLNLLLGSPHSTGDLSPQTELVAIGATNGLIIGDGDF